MAKTKKPDVANQASQQQLRAVQQMLGLMPDSTSKRPLPDVVFICIDCEAFEHSQSQITEIGVAVLDTRDLTGLSGSDEMVTWFAKMKYAHYRPVEYSHLRNNNFIKGCPEQFNFGPTTWVKLADVKHVLRRAFFDPSKLDQAGLLDTPVGDKARRVVYVAHGASSDTAYMKQVGFNLAADANVAKTIDTQTIYGGSKKHPVGLHRMLLSLNIEPTNLHNAGNDAAYTLQAMVSMALKDHKNAGSIALDIPKFAGKLPPPKFHPRVAPQVWAGTAVRPEGGSEMPAQSVEEGPRIRWIPKHEKGTALQRRRHKQAVRHGRQAQEDRQKKG
ncbi:hypothetical protein B0A50_04320 [Salinomyces thailandicus]|uniref:Gfd2/YDR514C-like C-terminal domain-containing protein n=1 Tax=Salinomyces thailandicus TaxID=706561 RepID=A0A4U0TX27_9PEZI|nr:hypothetical protein B0A50_04320 [Salinomyces thailandica]